MREYYHKIRSNFSLFLKKIKWTKILKWIVWEFSGLKFIWMKIFPKGEKAPTFVLWVFGIYIAMFGIASQRYENSTYKIDSLVNSMESSLSTEKQAYALSRIPKIQWEPCPFKPEILNPRSVFLSLFGGNCQYDKQVNHLKDILVDYNNKLESLNLSYCDLRGTTFLNCSFSRSALMYSKIEQSMFGNVKFIGTDFFNAKFDKSWFAGCDFKNANLLSVSLDKTFFSDCNLKEAKGIKLEQLLKCRSIYNCQLKPSWEKIIKEKYPNKMKWPRDGLPQSEMQVQLKRDMPEEFDKIFWEHNKD